MRTPPFLYSIKDVENEQTSTPLQFETAIKVDKSDVALLFTSNCL